jgi:hypothetical protein
MRRAANGAALVLMLGTIGCATTPPTAELVDSKVAIRQAREAGAAQDPAAQKHLAIAVEQDRLAQQLIDQGDEEGAQLALMRSAADAELALVLARETPARDGARDARERLREQRPDED